MKEDQEQQMAQLGWEQEAEAPMGIYVRRGESVAGVEASTGDGSLQTVEARQAWQQLEQQFAMRRQERVNCIE